MAPKVTLHNVAEVAGVSVATASRALAGKERVAQSTTAKVKAAALSLGYRVDPIARALREGSTRIIGMIVPVIGNPFFAQLVDAVEQELHERGFELLLADSHGSSEEEARRLTVFEDRKVDGVIIVPTGGPSSARSLRTLRDTTAVVQVDRIAGPSITDVVTVDNGRGMALVIDHLVGLGVHEVAYAGADDANDTGRERWEAFNRYAASAQLITHFSYRDAFDVATGTAAADALLQSAKLPDAVVAGSDLIAFGVISRLRENGVEVPSELFVTGFDGTQMSALFSPSLTTVVQPVEAIAREAVTFLLGRINGSDAPGRHNRIEPTLRVGSSTSRHLS